MGAWGLKLDELTQHPQMTKFCKTNFSNRALKAPSKMINRFFATKPRINHNNFNLIKNLVSSIWFQGHGPDKTVVCNLLQGCLFGELAILYNCRRTATITSKTKVTLWSLERTIFQTVVKSAGKNKDQERFETLQSVKDLKQLSEEKLRKIADCLEEETFEDNQCIIKQVLKIIFKALEFDDNY